MISRIARRLAPVLLAATILTAVGCGDEEPTGEAVPSPSDAVQSDSTASDNESDSESDAASESVAPATGPKMTTAWSTLRLPEDRAWDVKAGGSYADDGTYIRSGFLAEEGNAEQVARAWARDSFQWDGRGKPVPQPPRVVGGLEAAVIEAADEEMFFYMVGALDPRNDEIRTVQFEFVEDNEANRAAIDAVLASVEWKDVE